MDNQEDNLKQVQVRTHVNIAFYFFLMMTVQGTFMYTTFKDLCDGLPDRKIKNMNEVHCDLYDSISDFGLIQTSVSAVMTSFSALGCMFFGI